jgi:hypothetical protein
MQLQTALREPSAKSGEETLGLRTVLASPDEVVRKARDDAVVVRLRSPPSLDPQVEGRWLRTLRRAGRDR